MTTGRMSLQDDSVAVFEHLKLAKYPESLQIFLDVDQVFVVLAEDLEKVGFKHIGFLLIRSDPWNHDELLQSNLLFEIFSIFCFGDPQAPFIFVDPIFV